MKRLLFAASALTLAAVAPASAQMMMMGDRPKSCVSGGQFVACPPAGGMMQPGMMQPGMQPGMAMEEPGMKRKMTKREMREQRRMAKQQTM